MAVALEEIKATSACYSLLDDYVRFLVGWFRDALGRL
ncbi:MAG: TylF/MycF/NovP-related O-methyltransferase [Nitrospiraceae bacterium]